MRALALGVLAISTGAVLARRAGEAPATVIAFWRCALSAGLLAVLLLLKGDPGLVLREITRVRPRDRWLFIAAGACLGLHFQTWIASLELTTIASSTVLVSTTPVWVAIGTSPLVNRSAPALPRGTYLALAVCLAGSAAIGWGDFALSGRALAGDALALVGAVAAALYLLAGRHLRQTVALAPYLTIVYGIASLWLLVACVLGNASLWGYRTDTVLALACLAIFPQLLGHSTLNWALRWTSARLVAVAALGEPILASIWGALFEGEIPGPTTWLGGSLLLAGIYLTIRAESGRPRRVEPGSGSMEFEPRGPDPNTISKP